VSLKRATEKSEIDFLRQQITLDKQQITEYLKAINAKEQKITELDGKSIQSLGTKFCSISSFFFIIFFFS
jgi:hypothetical protein